MSLGALDRYSPEATALHFSLQLRCIRGEIEASGSTLVA